ncbi:calcium-translocating P-type ATPase, PMCA-type [Sphaeroforma arctica JP610]|uniref:Calcium-transporting ATPase n=1 Tax=Sphaeroforma arctica JP610 TaxID=667725 RepID=A0A0L0G3F8_9EUKA|nr:calcium-translocating P-type ATPase, PMCA-type [Sphaeroforma arctica JP610]KNC83376.1 calcium-translocating P-type ATPase, PMCA-type [Sphaeroforma arctica JP610]|eukprot:XP_014157278.1 calcium-translocating P-type ATPase, PMCA-type [Sphaeroforma arctica JP610]
MVPVDSLGLKLQEVVTYPKTRQPYDDLGKVDGIAKVLNVNLKTGLSNEQVKEHRKKYGPNVLPEVEIKSFWELVMEGFEDKTLILLSGSAIISLILGIRENPSTGWIEGTAIIMAVLIVVFVTAINDHEKEKQFRTLNAKKDARLVKILRNGEPQQLLVDEIVVGDVLFVETGDVLPVDGVLMYGSNIECDESAATGESDRIRKSHTAAKADVFFVSGAQVMDGVGKMLVTAVGTGSFYGKAMMGLRVETENTPLQDKLEDLANQIGFFGLIMAVITVGCLVAREYYTYHINDMPLDEHFVSALVRFVITGITILVVAIPEGLPLAVTMALAYSTIKMLEDNNLVRKLEACETMGGATTICSDKTGTLTQNKMTVVRGYIAQQNTTLEETESPLPLRVDEKVIELLSVGIATNTTAYVPEGHTEFVGNKTESALIGYIKEMGYDYKLIRRSVDQKAIFPFSSARKRMSSLVKQPSGVLRLHCKGAAELILDMCDTYINAKGDVVPLTADDSKANHNIIQEYASEGLRTICLCYTDMEDGDQDWEHSKPDETERMTLLGIVGIEDPIRPEVPEAVRRCAAAGIKTLMVTGDNSVTAKNIAKKCGIYNEKAGGLVMEGPEFRLLKDKPHELMTVIFRLQVLARSSPLDKQILVEALKKSNHVVAVTGDGTNDGPALKMAHVGFSMGITGTEVAKEASDIVLMDDNFSSIVKAVSWGRNVYDSIRKFIQFQLTVNIVAVILAFLGSLSSETGESPLKPVQLLWVNLIMDTLAALALATESPSPDLLNRPPYGKNAPLISRMMWRNILGQAFFQFIVNFYCLKDPESIFGPTDNGLPYESASNHLLHMTLFFNTFVMCQLFNEINSKKIHGEINVFEGFFASPMFLIVMLFTLFLQVLMVQYGGDWVGCTPLNQDQWIRTIVIGALGIPVGTLIRLLPDWGLPRTGNKAARDKFKGAVNAVRNEGHHREKHDLNLVEAFRRKHSHERRSLSNEESKKSN